MFSVKISLLKETHITMQRKKYFSPGGVAVVPGCKAHFILCFDFARDWMSPLRPYSWPEAPSDSTSRCDQRSREGTYQSVAELIRCSEVLLSGRGDSSPGPVSAQLEQTGELLTCRSLGTVAGETAHCVNRVTAESCQRRRCLHRMAANKVTAVHRAGDFQASPPSYSRKRIALSLTSV